MLEHTISHIKVVLMIFYLIAIIFIVFFSWLYFVRTIRATKAIGLHAPEYLKFMVRISIANAIVTAFLIAFFLLTNIY